MSKSYSSLECANRLHADMRDVMAQIHFAENGNRMEREQFLALLTRKTTILAEANSIISGVNETLNLAASDPNNRVPYHLYLDLKNARTIAREVTKMARSNSVRSTPVFYTPSTPVATSCSESDWLYELDDDAELPF